MMLIGLKQAVEDLRNIEWPRYHDYLNSQNVCNSGSLEFFHSLCVVENAAKRFGQFLHSITVSFVFTRNCWSV